MFCFFRCCTIELVSERCRVSRLDKVVDLKPTYISLFLEILSTKRIFELRYNFSSLQNSNRVGGIIVNNQVRGFRFIIVYDKFFFFLLGLVGSMFSTKL